MITNTTNFKKESKTMKENKIIWSNIDLDFDDWKEDLKEEYPNYSEDKLISLMYDINNEYLNDERVNLNIQISQPIIVIADLGLWNGRVHGYKILDNNISSILEKDCDYCEWYSDGYNIKFTGHHHDSTNYYEYREIRGDRNIENFLNDIYDGKEISRKKLNYYTKSLHPYIADIYGW